MRVQSDPVGRLVITGVPEHIDNPWGITPFKKVNYPFLNRDLGMTLRVIIEFVT